MMNIQWLTKIAEKNSGREITSRPFFYDGKTFATNGFILVAIDGDHGASPIDKNEIPKAFEEILHGSEDPKEQYTANWDRLLKWVGAEQEVVPCDECYGTGFYMCPHCDVDCDICGGTGKLLQNTKYGLLGGSLLDLFFLHVALNNLPRPASEHVDIEIENGAEKGYGNDGMVRIETHGWMIYVMPRIGPYAGAKDFDGLNAK